MKNDEVKICRWVYIFNQWALVSCTEDNYYIDCVEQRNAQIFYHILNRVEQTNG